MRDLRELRFWKIAHELTLSVYKATATFPKHEMYGLTSQMRRASASIPANIAEGSGRGTEAEMARFLQVALGSSAELEYHLILSLDVEYLKMHAYEELAAKTTDAKRMLTGFIQKLMLRIACIGPSIRENPYA